MANEVGSEWLGKNVDEAVKALTGTSGMSRVDKVPFDSMVTMDFRMDRIRVWYDPATNLVTSVTNG